MTRLAFALLLMVGSHVLPSAPGVRAELIRGLGRRGFLTLYSLVSAAALAAVVAAWRAAEGGPWLHDPPAAARYAALGIMPLALLLLVCRLTMPPARWAGRGVYRITTVPGSLAVLLWSLVHLAAVGEARAVLLFVAMAAIASASLLRHARAAAPAGRRLRAALPFGRILAGRERFVATEIGWGRLAAAVALAAAILRLHPLVIGVDPLAGVF